MSHVKLFERSRITFYCSEGIKELARDQMAKQEFVNSLLVEFDDGLYTYTSDLIGKPPLRCKKTVNASLDLQRCSHHINY
ncbi:ABC-three component system protein [Escherichia coli]|uniref:ABC-three component system protein n=1 Tax=Escherichia coli TaxID=562 RepID=UPI0027D97A85|nr:ABC-three component system protein [Escherichia coli]